MAQSESASILSTLLMFESLDWFRGHKLHEPPLNFMGKPWFPVDFHFNPVLEHPEALPGPQPHALTVDIVDPNGLLVCTAEARQRRHVETSVGASGKTLRPDGKTWGSLR